MVTATTTILEAVQVPATDPFQSSTSSTSSLPTCDPPQSFWQLTHEPRNNNAVYDVSVASEQARLPLDAYDLVIIGGGMSGVSAAFHASHKLDTQKGKRKVAVLEARTFCGGATGRNGGHLTPASALHYADFAKNSQSYLLKHLDSESREEVYGNDRGSKSDETIRRMLTLEQRTSGELLMLIRSEETKKKKAEMKRKAMERIRGTSQPQVTNETQLEQTKDPEINVDLFSGSNWYLCFSEAEEKLCDESLERAKRAGLSDLTRSVKKLTREEIDKSLSSPPNVVAAFEQPGATVHPLKLVSLIWKAAVAKAEERGISLEYFTQCPVEKVEEIDDGQYRSRLFSKAGEVKAKHLLFATNGYSSCLLPQLSGKIVPTRAQVIAAQPTSIDSVHWSMGLGSNDGFEYGLQRPNNSDTLPENRGNAPPVIFGGGRWKADGMEWGISDDSNKDEKISEFLRSYLPKHFPNSFNSARDPLVEWTGIMGYTPTSDPIVGPLLRDFSESASRREIIKGQWLSAGFSGHGMTRCYSTSEVVVDLIVAEESNRKWKAENWFPLCYLSDLPPEPSVEDAESESVLNGR